MTRQVEGKIAVITGAASGIGAAVSRLFHENGALLVLADVAPAVFQLAEELGDRAVAVQGDVSKSVDAVRMIDQAVSSFGGIDILCNVAGVPGNPGTLVECSDENFEYLLGVNLRGPFLTMKAAIPLMIARGGGSIVNIGSTAALKSYPQLVAYGAAKAGLVMMSRGAAVEYAKQGVRINVICPGPIETPAFFAAPGAAQRVAERVPMGRAGKPSEIAYPVLFLASSASSFMTGAIIPVEGGQIA